MIPARTIDWRSPSMVRWARQFLLGAVVTIASTGAVAAQPTDRPWLREHELVVSGGFIWSGGYSIGDSTAQLRSNATGSQPPPFALFATSSSIDSAAGIQVRVGVAITDRLLVEGGGEFSRPRVGVRLSRDAEAIAQTIDGERLNQVALTGGVVWQLPFTMGTRAGSFVTGGAGYLRQLHEERTLVETGTIVYVGGGIRYWIRGGHHAGRSMGVRGDVRANWRQAGIDFENKTRAFPSMTVVFFAGI